VFRHVATLFRRQPLPACVPAVEPKDAVDLRKYATPIGDQGNVAIVAFAWTHATELVTNIKTGSSPRLSPSFTMLQFQRMQGDAKDYKYAYAGGDRNHRRPGSREVAH